MKNNVLVKFDNEKEARAFEKDCIEILKKKKYSKPYNEYWYKEPGRWHFKSFLYILLWIIITTLLIRFFVVQFQKKPEPRVITNVVTVTGDTYQVTLNTNTLPAIGSMVYYYNSEIVMQSNAKLNQIRVDSDGITRFNICTQDEFNKICLLEKPWQVKWNYDEDRCQKRSEPEYSDCFDTSIIGSSEQELKNALCL